MPLSHADRIAREMEHPWLVELWRALVPLTSVLSFMNTGAHPDDETSEMLAVLGFRDGFDLSYACATRGEGGQNDIGQEAGAALGVLRTAEMERAAMRLRMRLYWLSETPDDSLFDFGFSKSGEETLRKWGKDRTLKRFVDILREEKPDIICPTFLDSPGQHGHHRAMTWAAEEAMGLAADPGYTASTLPPWQVSKMYLPAWSGAGQSYDDDLPPPPATMSIDGTGIDPATGISYARLGQQSRACHKTQAMGAWVPAGAEKNWPLHLLISHVGSHAHTLDDGLATHLQDLGDGENFLRADEEIQSALTAFPNPDAILQSASAALDFVRRGAPFADPRLLHKVRRKEEQLAYVIRLAAQVECNAWLERDSLLQSDQASYVTELRQGRATAFHVSTMLPDGWSEEGMTLSTDNTKSSDPYPVRYLPDTPAKPHLNLTVETHGTTSTTAVPFESPPQILPERSAALSPSAIVLNRSQGKKRFQLDVTGVTPTSSRPSLELPDGWTFKAVPAGFEIDVPETAAEGLYQATLLLDDVPAQTVTAIHHDHIEPRHLIRPAVVPIRIVDAGKTSARIGYIGAGHDRIAHWLSELGLTVDKIDPAALANETILQEFDTLVLGIFSMKFCDGLADAMPLLHRWTKAGGTLVTFYHRPWDNWNAEKTPPARLEIGQPSLRWRVTDENATVKTLIPDHPVFTNPNAIGPDDWSGWHKERGLYFAKSWDPVYQALIEMSDPDETPHQGALLAADVGRGRHIHCALILHHQMEKLVPGAFRLMVNLVSPRI